jgi:hypothetical protein
LCPFVAALAARSGQKAKKLFFNRVERVLAVHATAGITNPSPLQFLFNKAIHGSFMLILRGYRASSLPLANIPEKETGDVKKCYLEKGLFNPWY